MTLSLKMKFVDGSGNSDGDGDWFGWLEQKTLALFSVFRGGIEYGCSQVG